LRLRARMAFRTAATCKRTVPGEIPSWWAISL
jgi:hypothetical protein